ncbi:MAG: SH3 domain-containing protein [Thermomicrobiales bacterium]|nr:SH3 domain-containing protein [Thermomicrobiales bacterium]
MTRTSIDLSRRQLLAGAAATVAGLVVPGWLRGPLRAQEALPGVRYFAETGHNLGEPFLSRWTVTGGEQGIGLPISEERYDDDLGITQDFEGVSLTFDPGRPYPWTVRSQKLPEQFITAAAPAEALAKVSGCPAGSVFCEYFQETGHTISGNFVSYWSLHGDLPIIGLPVSEPFKDRETGRMVQVFDQAILEDHGENGITFRKINREVAEWRGWLTKRAFQPAPPTGGTTKLVSATDGLRLRTAPNADADVVAVLLDNAEFIGVPGEDGAWVPGFADGYSGWVASEYLRDPPPIPQIAIADWEIDVWQGAVLSGTNVREKPTTQSGVVRVLAAGEFVKVTEWVAGEEVLPQVAQWSKLDTGGYVFTRNIGRNAPVQPPPLKNGPASSGKWIDVHLTQQLMTAYEGSTPVRTVVTTTGMSGWETPEGQFWITVRVPNETMRGGTLGAENFFQLKNVLYTQYFSEEGHAIHYAWWRTPETIGRPGSHGCLNTLLEEARFFWDWAEINTMVVIRKT